MSPFTTTLIEWGATLLSLGGFWLCIQHRASCFVVFLIADLGWFISAWVNFHPTLLAQQSVYILLNVVGYVMWRRDDRLREALEEIEARKLTKVDDTRADSFSVITDRVGSSREVGSMDCWDRQD